MSLENGHGSPMETPHATILPQLSRSESELSEVNDAVSSTLPPAIAHPEAHSEDEDMQDDAASASEDEEDAAGSEDADYDVGTPQSAQSNDSRRNSISSSSSSSQPRKRKVEVDDDKFMQENPELYGLRRSVRTPFPVPPDHQLTLHRRVVPVRLAALCVSRIPP